MRLPRPALAFLILASIASATAATLAAQREAKDKYTKNLKFSVPVSQSDIDRLWDLHNEALRAGHLKSGAKVPLWEIYTAAANVVADFAATHIKRANLCREAMIALAGITSTTNRQKWTEVEITFVPPVGSSSAPYTTTAYVYFTAAYTGGKIRIHFEDENGKVIPGLEEECVNSKIPPYGGK